MAISGYELITVQGENVTGTFTSASFGELPITGTIKGQALEFKYQTAAAGEILYRGVACRFGAAKTWTKACFVREVRFEHRVVLEPIQHRDRRALKPKCSVELPKPILAW